MYFIYWSKSGVPKKFREEEKSDWIHMARILEANAWTSASSESISSTISSIMPKANESIVDAEAGSFTESNTTCYPLKTTFNRLEIEVNNLENSPLVLFIEESPFKSMFMMLEMMNYEKVSTTLSVSVLKSLSKIDCVFRLNSATEEHLFLSTYPCC